MPRLKVVIALDPDAMCVDAPYELAQVVKRITESFSDPRDPFEQPLRLRDTNGNQVGSCWIEQA